MAGKRKVNEDRDYVASSQWSKEGVKLHGMFTRAFPKFRTTDYGVFDSGKLAKALGVTKECVYRWFRAGNIPFKWADALIDLSKDRISFEDLKPFLK